MAERFERTTLTWSGPDPDRPAILHALVDARYDGLENRGDGSGDDSAHDRFQRAGYDVAAILGSGSP